MIPKQHLPIATAAFIAALLLGGLALHDRSEALAFGDHRGALLDDAVLASVSLPTGAVLLIHDSVPR